MNQTDITMNYSSSERIPKIIHYCWFGRNPIPETLKEYIQTWKKYCPDYNIIEWNESNFDLSTNAYAKEAHDAKKWAFVTDYVRLYVLYTYGGIYMDTDVEVTKNLDVLLDNYAFSGFESEHVIPTGIIGSQKNNPWIGYLLSYYADHHFKNSDNTLDITTNVVTITNMTNDRYNLKMDNSLQSIEGHFTIYPLEYFCPKDHKTGLIKATNNTFTIHHFAGSWCDVTVTESKSEKNKIITTHKWLYIVDSFSLGHKLLKIVIPVWTTYNAYGFKKLIIACKKKILKGRTKEKTS